MLSSPPPPLSSVIFSTSAASGEPTPWRTARDLPGANEVGSADRPVVGWNPPRGATEDAKPSVNATTPVSWCGGEGGEE